MTYPFQRSVWDALCSRTKKIWKIIHISRRKCWSNEQCSICELYNKHHYQVFAYNIFLEKGCELNKVKNPGLYKKTQKTTTITHSCSLLKYSALLLFIIITTTIILIIIITIIVIRYYYYYYYSTINIIIIIIIIITIIIINIIYYIIITNWM